MLNKKKHVIKILAIAVVAATFSSPTLAAKICKVKLTVPLPKAGTCDVDSTNPKMGNPFAYLDPNQACEFNFSLPGIPDLSLEGLKGSLCNMVQNMGQQAINQALAPILSKIPTTIDLDLNDVISGMFDDQMSYEDSFCPKYGSSGKLLSYKCPTKVTPPTSQDDKDIDWGYEISDGSGTKTKQEEYDTEGSSVDKNESLPYCKDLTSLMDENGNIIQCRNDNITTGTSGEINWDDFNSSTNTTTNDTGTNAGGNDSAINTNQSGVNFNNSTSKVTW